VGTTAPITARAVPNLDLPSGRTPVAWTLMLPGLVWLAMRNRKRSLVLALPLSLLALAVGTSCGGDGSSIHTTPAKGTPAGTYTVTVTAASGSLSHNLALQVIVQ